MLCPGGQGHRGDAALDVVASGAFAGHGRVIYRQSDGLALEPQGFPDAPHHPNFPSTELAPGQVFHEVTEYRFRTQQ